MSHQPKPIYEFGPYRLDAAERLLARDGEVVPLQPKVFDLLLALVERHGRLLEKDELMKAVWPDTIVEEVNLANNISILRKTLSENGERFIGTASKRGYRFVASVREIMEESVGLGREKQPESLKAIKKPDSATANGATAIARITSGESLGARLRSRKRGAVFTLTVLVVAAAVASFIWESLREKSGGAINSIAVLPFANADPTTEYLSDGITESLINSLSQLSQLKVIARTTAFRYKGKDAAPQTVGHDLKIDAVLTGRVTQQGETLIVQVDLVNAVDGAQLWGERYDRKLSNIITLQQEIVRQITQRLRLRLTSGERKQITKRYTENFDAYQQYLIGRSYAEKRTTEAYQKAVEHYKQALDLDPNYALPYVGLADAYYLNFGRHFPPGENIRQSRAAAVETYHTFGMVYAEKGMYGEAIAELNKAAPFSGGFASNIISLLGYNYALWGKRGEAIKRLDELKELSKRKIVPARDIAIIYTGLGEKDQAFKWLRQACEERDGMIVYLKFDPLFKSLRADPRVADLLQCVGLPQ